MGSPEYVFKPSSIKELYDIYTEWLRQDKETQSVFYVMTPKEPKPEKTMRFAVWKVELKKHWFRAHALILHIHTGDGYTTLTIRNPVWLVDDGMVYPVRTVVMGGKNVS